MVQRGRSFLNDNLPIAPWKQGNGSILKIDDASPEEESDRFSEQEEDTPLQVENNPKVTEPRQQTQANIPAAAEIAPPEIQQTFSVPEPEPKEINNGQPSEVVQQDVSVNNNHVKEILYSSLPLEEEKTEFLKTWGVDLRGLGCEIDPKNHSKVGHLCAIHFLCSLSPFIHRHRTHTINLSLVRLFASQRTNKEEIGVLTMWILTTWHWHLNNGCVILQAETNITALLSARKVSYMSYALSFLHCLLFLLWPSLLKTFVTCTPLHY